MSLTKSSDHSVATLTQRRVFDFLEPVRPLLAGSTLEGFAEHKKLNLVVDGEHTSTSNATKDISTRALEKRLHAFLGNDLASSIGR